MTWTFVRRERWGLLATLALALAGWCATWHVFTLSDLTHPIEYYWDSMFVMGVAKAAGDRGLGALWGAPIPWLGAPFPAQWTDFPVEDVFYLGMGLLGRLVGVVTATNLTFAAGALLAAATMYLTSRYLRAAPALAMLVGGLFSATPFIYYRNTNHLTLSMYWPMPFAALVWLWAGSRRGLVRGRLRFALAVSALLGLLNNYYLNYFMHVLLALGLVHLARRRWRHALRVGAVMVTGMGVFMLTNLDTLLYAAAHGRNLALGHQSFGDTLIWALRPMELFIPSDTHRLTEFARFGAFYRSITPSQGEFPSNYLGVVPGLMFVGLMATGLAAAFRLVRPGLHTRLFALSALLTVLALDGGVVMYEQLLTRTFLFRSNNRISVYLLGLGLLFGARALTPWLRRLTSLRARRLSWAGAVAVAAFGFWEQSPNQAARHSYIGGASYWEAREYFRRAFDSDARFTELLEARLNEGARVFQLPHLDFPEGGGSTNAPDYEPFRLYLHSHRKLQFSFGAMKGREQAQWSPQTAGLPPDALVQRLRGNGFGAVVINTRLMGAGLAAQLAQAAGVGPEQVLSSQNGDYVAVLLTPAG